MQKPTKAPVPIGAARVRDCERLEPRAEPEGQPARATTASRLFAMAWQAFSLPRPLAGVFPAASQPSQPSVSQYEAVLLKRCTKLRWLYHVEVFHPLRNCLLVLSCAGSLAEQSFTAPAGIRPAQRRPAGALLPGGRIIQPEGEQFITGSGPFGLAVSPEGKSVVTANGGPGRNSLTILERDKNNHW